MDGSVSEDGSLGPMSLTIGLPGDGSADMLQELHNDNRLLKEYLVELNNAMELAYEKLSCTNDQHIKDRQDFEEKFKEAKEVVETLREEVQQKNDLIETMKLQAVGEVKYENTDDESVSSQISVLKKSFESATQERDELKNKCAAFEMHLESEVANDEELRKQDRRTIESLQTTIESLKREQAKERDEKQELSDSLNHMRGTFDVLCLEYEKLINDEKINKAALKTKDGQIQQLQFFIQQLESNCFALQTQVQICRSDLEGERNAREILKRQNVTLKETLQRLTMPRDGQRPSVVGPPMNAGPSSLNAGPSVMNAGPPYNMNAGPSSLNAGPSSMNARPYNMNAGPSSLNAGPSSMNAGPYSMNAGPSSLNAGPSALNAGLYNMNAGPSSTNAGPYNMNACPSSVNAGSSMNAGAYYMNAAPPSMNAHQKNEVCICPKCGHQAQNIDTLFLHTRTCTA